MLLYDIIILYRFSYCIHTILTMQTEKNSGERWDKMRQDLMHRSQHVTMLSQCCHNAVVWTIVNSAKSPRFSKILQEIMKTVEAYENHPWMALWIALGILRHAQLFGSLQSHLSNRNSPWLRSFNHKLTNLSDFAPCSVSRFAKWET